MGHHHQQLFPSNIATLRHRQGFLLTHIPLVDYAYSGKIGNLHRTVGCKTHCLLPQEEENGVPKSHEILMFVCLQKDAKQCCEVTKLDGTQFFDV